eukprot:m.127425 g.127425  ORF g.127425 m.127425 type:complete len:311 (-) comp16365_c2_seq1:1288-2220(-)
MAASTAAAAAAALPALPVVQRLSAAVVRVLGLNPGPFTLQGTNTYIVGTGARRLLVDTGEGVVGYTEQLGRALGMLDSDIEPSSTATSSQQQKPTCSISQVILTHWHNDHVGGVEDVQQINVAAGLPAPSFLKYPLPAKDTRQYNQLKDNDRIAVDGATLRVVHTPGHTDDHVVLFLEEENAVFSGDCILGSGTTVFERLGPYLESLKKIRNLQPSLIYPGHGPVVTNPVAVVEQYLQHRETREREILASMASKQKMTLLDIVKVVYVGIQPGVVRGAAGNVLHHLEKLMSEGKVACNDAPVETRSFWLL